MWLKCEDDSYLDAQIVLWDTNTIKSYGIFSYVASRFLQITIKYDNGTEIILV